MIATPSRAELLCEADLAHRQYKRYRAGWLATQGRAHLAADLIVSTGRLDIRTLSPGKDWPALHETFGEMIAKLRQQCA